LWAIYQSIMVVISQEFFRILENSVDQICTVYSDLTLSIINRKRRFFFPIYLLCMDDIAFWYLLSSLSLLCLLPGVFAGEDVCTGLAIFL